MKKSLYVSHSKRGAEHYYLDASARYRCVFPCEYDEADHNKHCIHFDQIEKADLNIYQSVIFHRPQFSRKLKRIVKKLNKLKIKAIVDFDDLLFKPEYALQNPTYLSGKMTASHAKKNTYEYFKALRLFKFAQASTDQLNQHIKAAHPACTVVTHYNKLPKRWTKLVPMMSVEERFQNKIIRYFPGTSHHTNNFNHAIKSLNLILKENPDIKLEVIGDIHISPNTFPSNQFSQHPPVMFEELPSLITNSWLTISPLEDNEFNRCKSALKFWESGCFSVPVISNKTPDMERLACKGLLLSDNQTDWLNYINKLKNISFYKEASNTALSSVKSSIHKSSASQINHPNLQLIMCAYFGPTWPAIIYNPINKQNEKAVEKLYIETKTNNKKEITEKEKALLKRKALKQKETLFTNQIKGQFYKKVIKLKKNPKLFFKDMLLKKINTP